METEAASASVQVQAAFGLFDDDSSEDEVVAPPVVDLVEQLRSAAPPPAPATASHRSSSSSAVPTRTAVDADTALAARSSTTKLYEPWEDVRPLFVGPIELISDYAHVGGSRGYVAAEDLEPGTLVLVEKVYMSWPRHMDKSDPAFFMAAIERILTRPDCEQVMTHLSYMHPQRLTDLPEEMLRAGQDKYGKLVAQMCDKFATRGFTHEQLLQLMFAMQCNGFDSGVFLFCAIFNHECNPNCVKFTPDDREHGISEVRVAKRIAKGEPLSISYLYPREQSRSKRLSIMRHQFGFVCTCWLCARGDSVLTLPTPVPEVVPAVDAVSIQTVEIEEVEAVVATAEEMLTSERESEAKVLSIALEALSDALEVVAHDHFVLIRIHKLVADCCDEILKARPSEDVREYAILFLRSSYELLELQKMYLNADHMDLARTLNDVSQGIQLLLSLDPKVLLEEFSEWKDFRQASLVENKNRQEYLRIKRLYE